MYRHPLYRSAPRPLQELALDARWLAEQGARRLAGSRQRLAEVLDTQEYDSERMAAWQADRLDRLMRAARGGSPYYRDLFASLDIRGPGDLARLPILRKDDVRQHQATMLNRSYRGPTVSGGTSGTSGSPLVLRKSLEEIGYETAFYQRQLRWAGYQPGDRLAWLRGDTIVDPVETRGPFWRRSRLGRTLYLSSYHLSPATAADYVEALAAFRPAVIQAYPSSIAFLARHLADAGSRYGASLKGIVTSSETLRPDDRQLIEDRFGARVFDWYGSYERVAAIGTCEEGSYHLLTDYSLPELVGDGPEYRLVGTGIHNLAMPLFRYDTGDRVRRTARTDCPCGRAFPVVDSVLGREDDAVRTPSGRRIARLGNALKPVTGLLEARILQEEPDRIQVEVVTTQGFDDSQEQLLREGIDHLTGRELVIEIRRVECIARGPRGKHQLVVSRIRDNPRP